jgi:hypothetical protein
MNRQLLAILMSFVSIILLSWLAPEAYGQRRTYQVGGIAIYNATDQQLTFQLSRHDGRNTSFRLRPGEAQEYDCGFSKIFVSTSGATGQPANVKRNLRCQTRYALDWNDDLGCWDVFLDE